MKVLGKVAIRGHILYGCFHLLGDRLSTTVSLETHQVTPGLSRSVSGLGGSISGWLLCVLSATHSGPDSPCLVHPIMMWHHHCGLQPHFCLCMLAWAAIWVQLSRLSDSLNEGLEHSGAVCESELCVDYCVSGSLIDLTLRLRERKRSRYPKGQSIIFLGNQGKLTSVRTSVPPWLK